MKQNKPNILFYDIETTYLMVRTFRLGDQLLRHDSLVPGFDRYNIICIAYAWLDKPGVHIMHWDPITHDSSEMIEAFGEVLKMADVAIGKNSDRFDIKQLNTLRMLDGQPALDWPLTDDLEKQMRKHFYLPSYSLDYFDKLLFGDGKLEMKMQHWIDIQERTKDEVKSFKRMCTYCGKDVLKTKKHWKRVFANITPKLNMQAFTGDVGCKLCGSTNIVKDGSSISGKVKYQKFACRANPTDHSYAGKRPWNAKPNVKLS